MRLSRLNIAGFKSFPDRSELGFDDGVTAIVGPNGCGKSNVVDAITWVLGEQSAKSLRGERMEDVIFNGSEARKPTAAAEVRLKFSQVVRAVMGEPVGEADSADGQIPLARDVEIGRRLYRSGESEYLIDGEVCRLRDIHDLLMDSGLGVKAYAVIEQGKIGQILSSRPAERRMLIEEAAGVTKYKSRRRAAELKLEAAQQNLTRVDDIIFEVEKQRGALKRQAARARRYKRLREELRTWEQVQFARRYETLSREIAAAEARWQAAHEREQAADAELAAREASLEAHRLGLMEAEADAAATRERAHGKELEIGRRQQQIQFETQQGEDLAQQADVLTLEAGDLERRREPAAQAITAQRDTAQRVRIALDESTFQVADREQAHARAVSAIQAVEQDADAARATVLAAATTLSALSQARDHAAAVRDRVAAERERLEFEARDLQAEAARLLLTQTEAAAALADARIQLDRMRGERRVLDEVVAGHRAERERLAQASGTKGRELAGTEARLHSLEELESRRASFGDAARLLLAETGATLCPYGAVADHLVVERSYERAVDALLGERLQYVIVAGVADVSAALAMVSGRNAGRCGFVVLGQAEDTAAVRPLSVPPDARSLASVARATGPHAASVAHLIVDALVVETFEEARALAPTVSVPVATLAGDVFHGGWLVEGGWRQDVRGILETRAEMLSLREDVATLTSGLQALAAEADDVETQLAGSEQGLATLVADQHAHEKAIVGLEGHATHTVDDRDRVTRRLAVVAAEGSRAEAEQESTERRREETVAAIAAHEQGMRVAENTLSEVLERLQTTRDAGEAAMRLVSEARTDQATLAERMSAMDAETRRLEEMAADLEARLAARRADVARLQVRREELRESVRETTATLDQDVRTLDGLKADLRGLDERVVELRATFAVLDQGIRRARQVLDEIRADVSQAEVARARGTADREHLGETCLEAVGLTLDEVTAAVEQLQASGALVAPVEPAVSVVEDEDEDLEAEPASAAGAQSIAALDAPAADVAPVNPDEIIAGLRRKIERLGPVNMMAIEQFDELDTRHTFLTTQRADLLDSIAQTGDAIRKIDKTTRERFSEAFESINHHFERTFTTLFGGGRAGLVMIDQDNDQESGIDIIAQPPGKRLQNVQLLSGGEKALTAMALMFAVFKHRPSPFCLLDEIDAPLDDANVGRFIEMLQGMQEHTQFILVTHHRRTMEIADRLYGVTMEEPGVSKLISLQLN